MGRVSNCSTVLGKPWPANVKSMRAKVAHHRSPESGLSGPALILLHSTMLSHCLRVAREERWPCCDHSRRSKGMVGVDINELLFQQQVVFKEISAGLLHGHGYH